MNSLHHFEAYESSYHCLCFVEERIRIVFVFLFAPQQNDVVTLCSWYDRIRRPPAPRRRSSPWWLLTKEMNIIVRPYKTNIIDFILYTICFLFTFSSPGARGNNTNTRGLPRRWCPSCQEVTAPQVNSSYRFLGLPYILSSCQVEYEVQSLLC